MKFLKYIETLKNKILTKNGPIYMTESDLMDLKNTVPFIFICSEKDIYETNRLLRGDPSKVTCRLDNINNISAPESVDLPYECCFFEIKESFILMDEKDGGYFKITGLWIKELDPKKYLIRSLVEYSDGTVKIIEYNEERSRLFFLGMIQGFLNKLSKEEIGQINPRTSVKIKVSGKKIQHRISKVYYVSNKKYAAQAQKGEPKEIDWSCAWMVRGHWRHIPGRKGKDRDGNPKSDYTWVASYTKGPEEKEIFIKPRVVTVD